jgi:hypothetical protein
MAILLMTISGYSIGGYSINGYFIILVAIASYYINDY